MVKAKDLRLPSRNLGKVPTREQVRSKIKDEMLEQAYIQLADIQEDNENKRKNKLLPPRPPRLKRGT